MFIVETQKAVKGSKMRETPLTDNLKPLFDWLEKLNTFLDEVPPIE
jgi:serine/threonine-protein phosphatase 2A activator